MKLNLTDNKRCSLLTLIIIMIIFDKFCKGCFRQSPCGREWVPAHRCYEERGHWIPIRGCRDRCSTCYPPIENLTATCFDHFCYCTRDKHRNQLDWPTLLENS